MPSTLRWRPPGRPQTALSRRDAGRPQSKRRWVVSPATGKGRAAAAAFLRPARMRLSSRVAGTNPVCGDGALYYARGGGDCPCYDDTFIAALFLPKIEAQIGRASCRERG